MGDSVVTRPKQPKAGSPREQPVKDPVRTVEDLVAGFTPLKPFSPSPRKTNAEIDLNALRKRESLSAVLPKFERKSVVTEMKSDGPRRDSKVPNQSRRNIRSPEQVEQQYLKANRKNKGRKSPKRGKRKAAESATGKDRKRKIKQDRKINTKERQKQRGRARRRKRDGLTHDINHSYSGTPARSASAKIGSCTPPPVQKRPEQREETT